MPAITFVRFRTCPLNFDVGAIAHVYTVSYIGDEINRSPDASLVCGGPFPGRPLCTTDGKDWLDDRAYRAEWETMANALDYSEDYRRHYGSEYADRGTYETYAPAYENGARMATDPAYSGRSFEDVESILRTDYLQNNPNSTWDQIKGAVCYGWERATGKRGPDPTGVTAGTRGTTEYDTDYRTHHTSTYNSTGRTYDEYRPAYEYGAPAATEPKYHGRSFDEVEDTLRTDYLRNNPNSTWDNVKGAVRYAWEKITGKRP